MSRYIDADKLLEVLNGFTKFHHIETLAVGTFVDMVTDIPTADVQKEIDYWHDKASSYEQTIVKLSNALADRREVVSGEGEVIDYAEPCRYGCSICRIFAWHPTNYCPNCGAEMVERREE